MGCDIHWVVQKQVQPKDKWDEPTFINICRGYERRDYRLFSILANVRNTWDNGKFNFISESKGLPNNLGHCYLSNIQQKEDKVSLYSIEMVLSENDYYTLKTEGVNYHQEEENGGEKVWLGEHSHTWFTLTELLEFNWDQTIIVGIEGNTKTYKELVGDTFFDFLIELKGYTEQEEISTDLIRFIIGFDN